MTVIQHGRNPIETKTVKMIFLEPIFAVGQQEMNNLIFPIIKAKRVPSGMFAPITRIKKLVRVAREISQALRFVLHRMRMNDIHNNSHPILVRRID